jgi:hypothetical protein
MWECVFDTSNDTKRPSNISSIASNGPKFGKYSNENDEGLIYAQAQLGICQQLGGHLHEALYNFEVE